MKDPQVIICDNKGNLTGEYMPREAAHTGAGKRHLAITVLLYNNQGQILLQKRKHKRFDNIWDFTGATDLYHLEGGDETFEAATERCLTREYGISSIKVRKTKSFSYFAPYKRQCENEYCALMIGEYNGEVEMNPEVGYRYKWIAKEELLKDIEKNPNKYSPWAVEGVKILKKTGFFSN